MEITAKIAVKMMENGAEHIMLGHLSQENNTPDTAYDACVSSVGDGGVRICVAHPEEITELILEEL